MIGAHQISFTETDVEPTLTEVNQIEDEIFDVSSAGTIFEENTESSGVDVEGISQTLSLDFSIPTDLFSQYIDANVPSVTRDTLKTTFHNVDDVFALHECEADHEPCHGEPTTVSSCGDITETDATTFGGPIEKEYTNDVIETDPSLSRGQEITGDILDAVDMEIETEEINPVVAEHTVVIGDRSNPGILYHCNLAYCYNYYF